ncbi:MULTISPECIES: sensor histidine kinase [Chitinophagaceae]
MDKGKFLSAQLVFNIITWILILFMPFLFFPYNRDFSPFHSERFVTWYTFSIIYLVAFYYVNGYVFIDKLLARKKILAYIILTLACFFLYLYLFNFISRTAMETQKFMFEHKRDVKFNRLPKYVYFFSAGPITLFLISWIGSSVANIVSRWFTAEKVKEEMTKQKLETELSFLKSQVNPHFLFNTLNSIYTLAVTSNPNTADSVLKLSRIMRYTLEEARNNYVHLNAEVEFIQSYIDLQKMRLNSNVQVNFEVQGDTNLVQVPPLIFIAFVENAFKYGISAHHPSTISVMIRMNENDLEFVCENDMFPNNPKQEGTGTGIVNVQRRLELLYGKQYDLEIATSDKFKVDLHFPVSVK